MTQSDINALIRRLQTCDTPTVCNAIEAAQGKRGFDGLTHHAVVWSSGPNERVEGFARTARIAGNVPPTDRPADIRARRMAYLEAMNDSRRPPGRRSGRGLGRRRDSRRRLRFC